MRDLFKIFNHSICLTVCYHWVLILTKKVFYFQRRVKILLSDANIPFLGFLRRNPPTAMQFGQLLTHLDTTQQMINNSLKDNNTLLTQVEDTDTHTHCLVNSGCVCLSVRVPHPPPGAPVVSPGLSHLVPTRSSRRWRRTWRRWRRTLLPWIKGLRSSPINASCPGARYGQTCRSESSERQRGLTAVLVLRSSLALLFASVSLTGMLRVREDWKSTNTLLLQLLFLASSWYQQTSTTFTPPT